MSLVLRLTANPYFLLGENMKYEEFVLSKIVNSNVENYDSLLKAVLQTSVAPSVYLKDKLTKQKVSAGLKTMFGDLLHKSKNTSVNFYFYKQYRETILNIAEDTNKVCSTCKNNLPVSNFYSNGYQPNGKKKYKAKCKQCAEQHSKTRIHTIILEIIGNYSCKICGYDKCNEALEFHHIDPSKKEYEIKDLRSHSKETLVKEIDKCILVCANCHREIHYGFYPEYLLK